MNKFLTGKEVIRLQRIHRKTKNRRQADRIKTILCLNDGYSYEEIATILLLDDSTIRTYEQEYQEGGLSELLKDHYVGKKSKLNKREERLLKFHLKIKTYRTSKEVVEYVAGRFGKEYSTRGIIKLLHRLGFVYKKPKIVPGKADREKQQEFIEQYEELKAKKSPEDRIYFADASHTHHNVIASYGWIEKGKEKHLRTNSGRKRINLHGILNSEDVTDVEMFSEETVNADSVIRALGRLRIKQKNGKIYVIIDNARYYHAKKVKAYVEKHPRIKLIFLPSYSPNLNLIERLWLFFQKKVLYNRYYRDFKEFEKRCLQFFTELRRYRRALESLLIDNFQVIGA